MTQHDEEWARIACEVLETRYPYGCGHLATGPGDLDIEPARLHPAFHGAYDWHSSVHMQWSLVTLLGHGGLDRETAFRARWLLAERLRAENLDAEIRYLRTHPGFERPYGLVWALLLCAELPRGAPTRGFAAVTGPLVDTVAELLGGWLAGLRYPVRHGTHANTAFALSTLYRAGTGLGHEIADTARETALRLFAADTGYDTRFEPSGNEFLSPALTEAELMCAVLPAGERTAWLDRFLPGLGGENHRTLLTAPEVDDPADGQQGHLYGLALSRAWQLRALAAHLPAERAASVRAAANTQFASALPVVTAGNFHATHWLVSFALLAEGAQS